MVITYRKLGKCLLENSLIAIVLILQMWEALQNFEWCSDWTDLTNLQRRAFSFNLKQEIPAELNQFLTVI